MGRELTNDELNYYIKPATGEPTHLAAMMQQAFEQIGMSMMSDDFAAKVLAFVYIFGSELCVLHEGLNAGIMIAQQKANLYGGNIPNATMLPLIQQRIKELEWAFKIEKMSREEYIEAVPGLIEGVSWMHEIYDRYQLQSPGRVKQSKDKQHGKDI